MDSGRRARASRVRVAITMMATILVVTGEFALLTFVYQRGMPVRDQRLQVVALSGEWRTVATPVPASVLESTDAAISRLVSSGLDRSRAATLQHDLDAVRCSAEQRQRAGGICGRTG